MKKLFALLLLFPLSLMAQVVRIEQPVLTTGPNVPILNPPYPQTLSVTNATVAICGYPANGTPCSNYATTYSDQSGTTTCPSYAQMTLNGTNACVSTTSIRGEMGAWVQAGTYSYSITTPAGIYNGIITAGSTSGSGFVAAHDLTGSQTSQTVVGINGTNLAAVGNGIFKFNSGIPSLAVSGTDYVLPSGNVATATALAGTPTLCSSGFSPIGILPNGNATECQAVGGGASFPSTSALVTNIDTTTSRNATTADISTLLKTIGSCTAGQVYDPFDNICVAPGTGGSSPGGPSFAVQYNNSSAFGGVSAFNFQPGTGTLSSTAINSPTGLYENVPYGQNVVADGGADPTGAVDASAIFTSLATSNSTVVVPSGTYLLAASANLTLPATTTFQFLNGAKIKTGNSATGTITSISRATPGNAASSLETLINLATAGATSSSTASAITINVTNTLPSGPIIVKLTGTTNVTAGTYSAQSVSGSTIVLTCVAACTVKSLASESGTLAFYPGNFTYVHLSAPLTGLTVPCVSMPIVVGPTCGQVVITGTTNYNGPYLIYSIPDSTDLALYDFRIGAATETSGSISVPYVVQFNGGIQASSRQQIVTANSAVTFKGATEVYPEWYGAQGAIASSNDWLPLQNTLYWSHGQNVELQKYCPELQKGLVASCVDYYTLDTLQGYGNHQVIEGNRSNGVYLNTLLSGSTTTASGPIIHLTPLQIAPEVRHLTIAGNTPNTNIWVSSNLTTYTQYAAADGYGPDGILITAGEAKLIDVGFIGMQRHGCLFDGSYIAYNPILFEPEPDYWTVNGIFADANKGYGCVAVGGDAQGGQLLGATNFSANEYGGFLSNAENGNSFVGLNGEGNGQLALSVGTTQTISSMTVSGGVATLVTTAALANGVPTVNTWVTTTGTVAGGGTGTDGTWQVLTVNTGTQTISFNCPGCSGTATSGSVGTASSAQVYAVLGTSPTGHGGTMTVGGNIVSFDSSWTPNMYSEGTNNCTVGNFDMGSEDEGLARSCNALGAGIVGIYKGGVNLDILTSSVTMFQTLTTPTNIAFTMNNASSGSNALTFVNASVTNWSIIGTPSSFKITDDQDTFTNIIQVNTGGVLDIDAPVVSGVGQAINIDAAQTTPGPVNFFPSQTGGSAVVINPSTPFTVRLGLNMTGAASPLQVGGSAGTSGQCLESAGAGVTPTWATCSSGAGAPVPGAHASTYTVLTGDRGNFLYFTGSSASSWTIPQSGSTGFAGNFFLYARNAGTAVLTLTPTTSTINGNATQTVLPGAAGILFSDNTNYYWMSIPIATGGTNSQTANYTAVQTDKTKTIQMNGSSLTLTLPATPPSADWWVWVNNQNSTNLTINPNSLNLNGSASNLVIGPQQSVMVYTNGANYFTNASVESASALTLNHFMLGAGLSVSKVDSTATTDGAGNATFSSVSVNGTNGGLNVFGEGPAATTATLPTDYVGILGPSTATGTPYLLQLTETQPAGQCPQFAAPTTVGSLTNVSVMSWVACGGGTGITGGTAGFLPLFGSATSITGNSHIDDGVTTASTLTATESLVDSTAGALSKPAFSLTGAPIGTGGSGTSTLPLMYLNAGTAPTTWSTAGTELGINAPSGFTGNFLDFHLNGAASVFSVTVNGVLTAASSITASSGSVQRTNLSALTSTGVYTFNTAGFGWSSNTAYTGTIDTILCRSGASGFMSLESAATCTSTVAGGTGTLAVANIEAGGSISVSGCSLTSAVGGASAGQFASGTTGTCTVTITPGITAAHGFFCRANDLTTTADTILQTASTTTTATIAGTTVSGDVVNFGCTAY